MRWLRWMLLSVWVCGTALGCGAEDDEPLVESRLEIGSGVTRFEPIMEGEVLALEAGAQGGHHVWISLRVQGLDPERAEVTIAGHVLGRDAPEGDVSFGRTTLRPARDDEAPGWFIQTGYPLRIWDPACAVGSALRVEATVTDRHGRSANATLQVTVGDDGILGPCPS